MSCNKNLHFVGIGGSGMSALAQLFAPGTWVTGSDRSWPSQDPAGHFAKLEKQGIGLFPQNGDGVGPSTVRVVLSTAIEKENPDLAKARSLGIPTIHRSDLLAEFARNHKAIAVSGTSGKSTICGMAGVLFEEMGLSPSVVNGGEILNFISETHLGNSKRGKGSHLILEADESDGTLSKYHPAVGVISNISKDHKPTAELEKLFFQWAGQIAKTLIWNRDCPLSRRLAWPTPKQITYALDADADVRARSIQLLQDGSRFTVDQIEFRLQVPGRQNVSNALAAIAAGLAAGLPLRQMPPALEAFRGIRRRLELLTRRGRFRLYDDFAHNPDKIRASLRTLLPHCRRLIAVFQPHGYQPTRFLFEEYVRAFAEELREQDKLLLLPIFDAGGTADRSISSADLASAIQKQRVNSEATYSREDLLERLKKLISPDDTVLVMGARDNSLTALCRAIAEQF